MKRNLHYFWLLFAQVATVCLGALFVVATLRPDLLARVSGRNNVVLVQESSPTVEATPVEGLAVAAKKAMPSVVNVYTSKEVRARNALLDDPLLRRFFPGLEGGEARRATSLGSGVIVSSEGYVLTNNHVIEGADDIQLVLSDGRRLRATVRGNDPESDLAVLKAEGSELPAITFGSLDHVQVGDAVLALGNPFGFGNTVTHGIVSALGRNHLGINRFEDFIQTDAAVNPGNSGGALIDASGNLIGINSAIYSENGGSQGIGFAIPVSLARTVLEQIIRDGEVTRGWLGIEPQEITPEIAAAFSLQSVDGLLIRSVVKNSPADRAGLQVRDVVLEIDGKPTRDSDALLSQIASLTPGRQATLKVLRDRKPIQVAVIVGRRPKPTG
ncbi:MAG TPA: trypsin-like peptidase domain-containing protein [Casimicrobiaceae bacterium]|nr:trypsin-like peptidase domain-containing protein [Casimicrobiaceae bacterium]